MSLRLFAAVAFAVITAYGQPLTIDPGAPPGGREGFPYLARLEANGGNRPYRWSVISGELPPGIAWTGIGILGGLPSRPGTFTFRVEVRDRNNDRAQANLQITIEPRSLSITSGSSLPEATAGAFYSYTLSASGGSPPYVWSVTGGSLPAGLLLAPAGVVAGTPAGPNASGFTVQVRDSRDATASATLALTVRAAPLRIVTGTLPRATVGIGYSQMLNGTGGTPPYVWSENGGALPPGLSLSAAGAISGTPTTVGVFSFSVRLSDGRETDTRELSIRVDPAPLTISTTALPNGAVNAAYSAILAAGGGAPPYAWSVASGSLPAGLSLATNGAISGTPAAAGSSTFTVRVTDGSSQNATRLLSITVAPATLSSPTTTLADGMVGVAYWTTLTANGGAPPYSWSVTSGILPAGLSLAANGAITGTPAAAGISTFTVRVTDSASQLATSSLSITIAPAALSITTASLPDGTIGQAYSATLTAGGGTAPYTWNMVSGSLPAGLSLSSSGAITGTPAAAGNSTFTARVTDGASQNATRSLSITVAPSTLSITTTSLPNGTVGAAFSATLVATGGANPYTWSVASGGLPAGLSLAPSGSITGTPVAPGSFSITVRVNDSSGAAATRALTLSIRAGDPTITTGSLPEGVAGGPYSAALSATGGAPPYSWRITQGSLPSGIALAASGSITGTATVTGDSQIRVQVTDSAGGSAAQNFTLRVRPSDLAIATESLAPARAGTPYAAQLAASGGQPPYAWTANSGSLPAGVALSPTGALTGTPSIPGTFAIAVRVSDKSGVSASRNFTLAVSAPLNIETPAPLATASLGAPYSQLLLAVGGAPPLLWSISAGDLPPGLSLSANGLISGTPTIAAEYQFSVQVADTSGATATRQYSIGVATGMVIATPPVLRGGTVRAPYSETLQASGGRPPYTWSIVEGGLPDGVRLEPSSGMLAGTPTATGVFGFMAAVTDAAASRATKQFTLTIAAPLVITSAPVLPDGTARAAYSVALRASGGRTPYTWSIAAGALPPGVELSPDAGLLSGTPAAAGSYRFTVRVEDSASASASVELALNVAGALDITTAPSLSAAVGAPYQQSLSASGGAPPYSWAVSTGALPPGVELSVTGQLSGTPSTAGAYRFTVRVADSRSAQATKDFDLNVGSGLTITTEPLPAATVGVSYSATLTAAGGASPYAWSVETGSLPDGVTLNASSGEFSGAPAAAGTFNFTIRVTDAAGQAASRTYTIVAQLPGAPSLRLTGIPPVAASADQTVFELQLDASYPVEINGVLTLDFEPDPAHNTDDPAVQFTTGGRSVLFRIPAGSTKAVFPDPQIAVQTGTVSGAIRLRAALSASGRNLAGSDAALQTITIERAVPAIRTVRLRLDGQTLIVEISGHSTPRGLKSVRLTFEAAAGASLQGSEFTLPVEELAANWYSGPASVRFGSMFTMRLPFTIQGAADAVGAVTAVLSNQLGDSAAVRSTQ